MLSRLGAYKDKEIAAYEKYMQTLEAAKCYTQEGIISGKYCCNSNPGPDRPRSDRLYFFRCI